MSHVGKTRAIRCLKDRQEYINKKLLARRLVGEPIGYLIEESKALDLALSALEETDREQLRVMKQLLRRVSNKLCVSLRGPNQEKLKADIDAALQADPIEDGYEQEAS